MNRMLFYVMYMSCVKGAQRFFQTVIPYFNSCPRAMATQAIRVTSQDAQLLGHPATLVCHVSAPVLMRVGPTLSPANLKPIRPSSLCLQIQQESRAQGFLPEPEPRAPHRIAWGCLKSCQAPPTPKHQRFS